MDSRQRCAAHFSIAAVLVHTVYVSRLVPTRSEYILITAFCIRAAKFKLLYIPFTVYSYTRARPWPYLLRLL